MDVAATDYTKSPEAFRAWLTRGIYTRVAVALRLGRNGRSHVRRVALGERRLPRVEKALSREFKRINRIVATFENGRAS